MFPLAVRAIRPADLCAVGGGDHYTRWSPWCRKDMKKLIAYSSVAHMGFVTMGIFAGTIQGVGGGHLPDASHGIISGRAVPERGVVYDRMHTGRSRPRRPRRSYAALMRAAFMVFTLANVGLPGTRGLSANPHPHRDIPGQHSGRNGWRPSVSSCLPPMRCGSTRKVIFGRLENFARGHLDLADARLPHSRRSLFSQSCSRLSQAVIERFAGFGRSAGENIIRRWRRENSRARQMRRILR